MKAVVALHHLADLALAEGKRRCLKRRGHFAVREVIAVRRHGIILGIAADERGKIHAAAVFGKHLIGKRAVVLDGLARIVFDENLLDADKCVAPEDGKQRFVPALDSAAFGGHGGKQLVLRAVHAHEKVKDLVGHEVLFQLCGVAGRAVVVAHGVDVFRR